MKVQQGLERICQKGVTGLCKVFEGQGGGSAHFVIRETPNNVLDLRLENFRVRFGPGSIPTNDQGHRVAVEQNC